MTAKNGAVLYYLTALQKQEQKTVLPSQTILSLRPTGGTTT
jgi:hypothetical protein